MVFKQLSFWCLLSEKHFRKNFIQHFLATINSNGLRLNRIVEGLGIEQSIQLSNVIIHYIIIIPYFYFCLLGPNFEINIVPRRKKGERERKKLSLYF